MKILGLVLLALALPVVAADVPAPPDVAMWNNAASMLHQFGDAQVVFVEAAKEWTQARQAELQTPGSVSATALRDYGKMWVAWQQMEEVHKATAKAMHDFDVVERNRQ